MPAGQPNLLIWDGTAWVPRQPIGSDGDVATIYPMKVSRDGVSWWPQIETGETAPSVPQSMSASATGTSTISVSWAAPATPGDFSEYRLYRGGTWIYTGTALSYNDSGLANGTTYTYTVYGVTPGGKYGPGASASATTDLGEITKSVTLSVHYGGSYDGNGNRRNTGGPYYSGYYSGTWGLQKSALAFNIPSDVRNCIRINSIEFACQNDHSYNASGVTQYIAITHTQVPGATWPGSTGVFGAKSTTRDGWWGGSQWQNITNLVEPSNNDTVANHFKNRGAWGICLVAPNTSQSYYSYWRLAGLQLRINYTVAG